MNLENPYKEYKVVISLEKQYSMWPTCKKIPFGWKETGKIGNQQECLVFINEIWTDLKPNIFKKKYKKKKI